MIDRDVRHAHTASGSGSNPRLPWVVVGLATIAMVCIAFLLGGDEAAGGLPMSGFALGLGLTMLLCVE